MNVPKAPSMVYIPDATEVPKDPGESQSGYPASSEVMAFSPRRSDAVIKTRKVPMDCLSRWGIFLESSLERLK